MPEKFNDQSFFQITALLKGLICSFVILIATTLILGFFFSLFDGIREETINGILMVMNYVAIFGGGLFTARFVNTRGWFNGGLVGFLYMITIIALGAQVIDVVFSLDIFLRIVSGFLCGAVGGVIGVNVK